MPDPSMLPAIRAALRAHELGSGDPYALSFALLGTSGASFGIFQADTASDPRAAATLRAVLNGAGMAPARIDAVLALLTKRCPFDPLNREDEAAVDAALASPQGRALVDALDEETVTVVTGNLDLAIAAAQNVGNSVEADAQLAICLWCNMTGTPTLLLSWLRGLAIEEPGGTVAAPGNPVALADMQRYLLRSTFFTNHPRNWTHFQASVAVGVRLLPVPAGAALAIS